MNIYDLISITPFPENYLDGDVVDYSVGDTITYKIDVPVINSFFDDKEIDLYENTNENKFGKFKIFIGDLFYNNEIIFVKGKQGNKKNLFKIPYNEITKTYEFELKIVLLKQETYRIHNREHLVFNSEDNCNFYLIETGFKVKSVQIRVE